MKRGELSDEQWEKLKALLPAQKSARGRPSHDHRRIIDGILWIDRTGAPWRDLPERYGPWQTVASRFYRWRKAGVWQKVLQSFQEKADTQGMLDWQVHYVDGTVIRAHQHVAGVKKGLKHRKRLAVVRVVGVLRST